MLSVPLNLQLLWLERITMSNTPIHDKLSSDFDVSKRWWKHQGALEEITITLTFLRTIKKPTKQTEDIIKLLEDRLKELGRKY